MSLALAPPPPPPPVRRDAAGKLLAGSRVPAGLRFATIHPDIDFETYSEAGYVYRQGEQKWIKTAKSSNGRGGLPAVGTAVYAMHPSTQVLCLAYDLKDGLGKRRWRPGTPLPQDLLDHVRKGGLIEAFNSAFEWWIWNCVCIRYGFPPLPLQQVRCAQAKGRAWSMPPSLDGVAEVLNLIERKDPEGERLMKLFSSPRDPTKKDARLRYTFDDLPAEGARYQDYNEQDIVVEAAVSERVPDLSPIELEYWLEVDRPCNTRGVAVDVEGVNNCITLIEQCHDRYNYELAVLTGGAVARGSELKKLIEWLARLGFYTDSLDDDHVQDALKRIRRYEWLVAHDWRDEDGEDRYLAYEDLHRVRDLPAVKRAIEIREAVGSASVKKVFAMRGQATARGRLHELFTFHGARTGRPTGNGPQPTNLPNSGPEVHRCDSCERWFPATEKHCTNCLTGEPARQCTVCRGWLPRGGISCCGKLYGPTAKPQEWNIDAAEDALRDIATRSLDLVEMRWGDAMGVLSGCLRPLFVAGEGCDLICSDYSAIEAVVNAALANETWRLEVFFGHGKIYEASAAAMFNKRVDELLQYAKDTGHHHPLRKKGKVAELALGYIGWIGALRAMGYEGSDAEAQELILAWRAASPSIVFLGGGQKATPALAGFHRYARNKGGVDLATDPAWATTRQMTANAKPWDATEPYLYGLEGGLVEALQRPGFTIPVVRLDGTHSGISWLYRGDVAYMLLPDGTTISYHRPRLSASDRDWKGLAISYEGYNTNSKVGPVGWITMWTYAGKLLENACQAVANRILRYGQVNLERAGYPIVMHIYDENVAEVRKGFGSVEHFEQVMSVMPGWAVTRDGRPWPVKAKGGWRGHRYRK